NCQKTLRIPADWLSEPIRCKHCGKSIQTRRKADPNGQKETPPPPIRAPATELSSAEPKELPLKIAEPDAPIVRVALRYRRSKTPGWLSFAVIGGLLIVTGIGVIAFWRPLVQFGAWLKASNTAVQTAIEKNDSGNSGKNTHPPSSGAFPRRAL